MLGFLRAWCWTLFFFFLYSIFSPWVISFTLMFSNAIYMLTGYKFISLGQVSFLSSRPLYLTHYSITPLGCMTGTSDLTYLKQNSWLYCTTLQPHISFNSPSPRLPGDTTPFHLPYTYSLSASSVDSTFWKYLESIHSYISPLTST